MAGGIVYNGVKYDSVKALAEEYGVRYSRLDYRLRQRTTMERALDPKKWEKSGTPIWYQGKKYISVCALIREKGKAGKYTVMARVNQLGWSWERALNTPARPRRDVKK